MPERDTLIDEVNRRVVHSNCPFCDHNGWHPGDDTAVVYYATDLLTTGEHGRAFGAFPFSCENCGFVRFHTLRSLKESASP